jgi:hypothetical protein
MEASFMSMTVLLHLCNKAKKAVDEFFGSIIETPSHMPLAAFSSIEKGESMDGIALERRSK